ncbi:hypothetical protein [Methylobacterium soli]|uniref:Uncharacterized protein n=1 Tax=Methylobacterium soli TaxID=553447 RepID=A0A6L3T3V6_9HYPH|nr:hypothetical protein [Methylobacterium soli]KAB1079666.1 hypothetical protein F6X53_10325 [Methylobacterium soli]GJE43739.1 hypothetical protein AEGHOMDF_2918 [Methylobacterium soli]
MASSNDQLGIYVDIGKNVVPRLNFTLGGHTTNVDIDVAGAANLGSSLLMASFLSSIGKGVPDGTLVSPGQLPVESVEGSVDPVTNLPTLKVGLIGGAELTLVFSADLAALGAASLTHQTLQVVKEQEAAKTAGSVN